MHSGFVVDVVVRFSFRHKDYSPGGEISSNVFAPYILSDTMHVPMVPPKHTVITRPGFANDGQHISLLTNDFEVSVGVPEATFYQYNVSITSDGKPVENKWTGRKIFHKLCNFELSGRRCAYDGGKNLYTVDMLSRNSFQFMVVLEEPKINMGSPSMTGKRSKHSSKSKAFKVDIVYASAIPVKSLVLNLHIAETNNNTKDALIVLDTILRQQAANRGCLLVRQSFFEDDIKNFTDVGGGVTACKGIYSSFFTTHNGLTLNIDVSNVLLLKPGPLVEFLLANQSANDPRYIDWEKAKRTLKNLRVRTTHLGRTFKIYGLSEKPCFQQLFPMKVKKGDNTSDGQEVTEISVYDYFTNFRGIKLSRSIYMPCLDVGKPNRPVFLPLELCELISLQHYKKSLSPVQKLSLIETSRQKPLEKIKILTDALRSCRYNEDPLLSACGITISKQLTQVEGRIIEAPKLKIGENDDFIPSNGRWNFSNKRLLKPIIIERWAVVNFSARCDTSYISRELISCARNIGILMERPYALVEEDSQSKRTDAVARVEKMFEELVEKLPGPPEFLLCVLPERKCCEIYGPWKKKTLIDLGIITQCISPSKVTDRYMYNVLLKINSKLGGINSLLEMEHTSCIPMLKDIPTMILGMVLSRGSSGQSTIPSIAAVVGSRCCPLISRYKASARTQPSAQEMIQCLYKRSENGNDTGIIRELLLEFYRTSNSRKPAQIIVFRDGVCEPQFNKVLDIELNQIMKAYWSLGEVDAPKFTVITTRRNHHIRLFHVGSQQNVPPGTVVDTNIVHPNNYDFYMCPHAAISGTSRPTQYTVLLDEIAFSPDELQKFVHSLSYVYQGGTSAISVVAPIRYAHLAARQMGQWIKSEGFSEGSPDTNLDLPRLHKNVQGAMFFC